jgi:hypothetical protein
MLTKKLTMSSGLGLPEIGRFGGHAGYRGVLLGLPGLRYHLEFHPA